MRVPRLVVSLGLVFAVAIPAACERGEPASDAEKVADTAGSVTVATRPPIVAMKAVDYAFEAPDTIRSGWTTLRLDNQGREIHFLSLWRLPDGKTLADYEAEVLPAFGAAYLPLEAGEVDKVEAGGILGERLPAWYAGVRSLGGVGFVAPGRTAETIVELVPGTYVMECYVKTAEGAYHGMLGMLRQLVVTSESTGAAPPAGDVEIRLTNAGIEAPATLAAGSHTIAVRFLEHPEVGLGNDVHVARLEQGMDPGTVTAWMDWMNVEGLRAPAPAEFVSGIHEMAVGTTAYFTADLEPGRYLWIGEAPEESPRFEEFAVE